MDFDHNPRKRLREFRAKHNWSVARMAKELVCSRQMVYALEADYGGTGKVPGLDLAARIAKVTGRASGWLSDPRVVGRAWARVAAVVGDVLSSRR
jgi:DNA-binding XRE family transcriptional regulator